MPAYVASLSATLDDNVSSGAAAAADALNKLADAADATTASTDATTASVTKAGASAASLAARFDPATKAASDLSKAQATLASAQSTMAAAVSSGSKTQEQADAVTATLTGRVRAAQAAVDQLSGSVSVTTKQMAGLTDANAEAAGSADTAGAAHAGFYREIVILGHEAITGNFSRIPGSLLVLAERSGQLEPIFKGVIAAVTSTAGIFTIAGAAGVAAFAGIALTVDNADTRLIGLQNQLRATHDGYQALAVAGEQAITKASNTIPGLGLADATAADAIFQRVPDFQGTSSQIVSLIQLSADLGKSLGQTTTDAAKTLAEAMEAPGTAAEKLVGKLKDMNQSLADSIKLQSDSGDKAGAFSRYLDVVKDSVGGANEALSPLRQALFDLENVFDSTATSAQKAGEGIGGAIRDAAVDVIKGVTGALATLKSFHDYLGTILPYAAQYGASIANQTPTALVAGYGDPGLYGDINTTGQSLGLNSDQLDLAHRIVAQESHGNQYNASGNTLTSSAGALGTFQVLPSTAAQYGQDPNTISGNISAGEQQLVHLWTKYSGNQSLVAMAYNWGEGNVDAWIAKGGKSAVPTETQNYVQSVAGQTTDQAFASIGTGVANTSQDVINQALQKDTGSLAATNQELQANIDLNKQAMAAMLADGITTKDQQDSYDRLSTSLAAETLQLSNSESALGKVDTAIERQISTQNQLATGYDHGTVAAAKAVAYTQAQAEAYTTVGERSADLGAVTDSLASQYLRLAEAQGRTAVAQQTLQNDNQLDYINAETSAIGLSATARQELLDHMKAEQELRAKLVPELSTEGQAYLHSADAVSAATAALAKQQQTMSDLESASTQVFDQVGQAITNAFANGSKSAADFGSIAKSVLTSVLEEVVKLGALNPILNSLFGGSRTTLGDVGNLISGTTSTSGGSAVAVPGGGTSNLFGLFGGGSGGFLNTPLWGGGSTAVDTLSFGSGVNPGITGVSTASAGTSLGGLLGGAGAGFGVGSLVNSFAGGNSTGGSIGSALGGVAGAAIGSIIPGVGTLIGGLIGGIGGGLLGGLFGGKPSDKTEFTYQDFGTGKITSGGSTGAEASSQNSQAAANLASQAYGAESSIATDFALQPLLSGITAKVGSRDGIFLQANDYPGQKYTGADTAAGAATVLNESVAGLIQDFGTGLDATTASILAKIDYSQSTATQQVQALADALTGGKLDATQQLVSGTLNSESSTQEISDLGFIKNTYEPATLAAQDPGSVATQTKALQDSYNAIIAHATTLGLATDTLVAGEAAQIQKLNDQANEQVASIQAGLTSTAQSLSGDSLGAALTQFDAAAAQQQTQLTDTLTGLFGDAYKASAAYAAQVDQLTSNLAEQRADLILQQQEQQQSSIDGVNSTLAGIQADTGKSYASIAQGGGTLAGAQWANSENESADLFTFDYQAKVQQDSLSSQLISTYGQSYTTTAAYAQDMASLEDSLAAQRLAIQAKYTQQSVDLADSADQAASSVIGNLSSFITSLETGSASPLNAQSQYGLAQQNYQTDLAGAQAGDATSLTNLQGYASAYLSASQNLYGSGAGYANDYTAVLQALNGIASTSQDTLTASFYAAQVQNQTDILAANQAALLAASNSILLELRQQNARPVAA